MFGAQKILYASKLTSCGPKKQTCNQKAQKASLDHRNMKDSVSEMDVFNIAGRWSGLKLWSLF